MDVRDEPIAHLGDQIVFCELVPVEDGQRLAGQVDHDGVLGDTRDLSEDFFAHVKRGALARMRAVLSRSRFLSALVLGRPLSALLLAFFARLGLGG